MNSGIPLWIWVMFNGFVLAMLALDLGVFHRKSHEVKFKEAIAWSGVWISLALIFNALIFFYWKSIAPTSEYSSGEAAMKFFTAYVIEKALSVDNIFVFLMIFGYFQVPSKYQHKVLFWGILGALVMRALCIWGGIALLERFHWLIYVFGAFLIFTGIKMLVSKDKEIEPEKNPLLKFFRRVVPVTDDYEGDKFFVRRPLSSQDGRLRLWATPLFVVLLFVEMTDVIFAVDSIPAVLSLTRDPFLVYTSNVFAILGLRALFFALAGVMNMFAYLTYGLSAILVFVGAKMLVADVVGKIPIGISLGVIVGILTVCVLASIYFPPAKPPHSVEAAPDA